MPEGLGPLLPYILLGTLAYYGAVGITHGVKKGAAKATHAIAHVLKHGLRKHEDAPKP